MMKQEKIENDNFSLFVRIKRQKAHLDNTLTENSSKVIQNHNRLYSGSSKIEMQKEKQGGENSKWKDIRKQRPYSFDGGFSHTEEIIENIDRNRREILKKKEPLDVYLMSKTFSSNTAYPNNPKNKNGFFQQFKKKNTPHTLKSIHTETKNSEQPKQHDLIYIGNFETRIDKESMCFEVRVDRTKPSSQHSNRSI